MVFTAPAKINLYLGVIQPRDDGYHEIETLFERISVSDRITIEPDQMNTTITCDDPSVPTGETSLMARTIEAFRKKSGVDLHFRVTIEKNIPIGAGLGGGSSDAATLLKGINRLSGHPLGEDAMLQTGQTLGADVPFFLSDCSFGIGKGRGDIIQKVDTQLDLWHVLVNPPFEVSTKDVYGKVPAFGLTKRGGVDRMMTAFSDDNNINILAENLHNDLQALVLGDFPILERVFSELANSGAKGVLLSGSGPTVFGIFGRDEAIKAAERLRYIFTAEKNWRIYVARTC
ncbi:MAG: 4-(cytidine 5'-diphospho)-2-C-methyl-D-erythritol kinase [Candidatus Omnitrophota bacterium]